MLNTRVVKTAVVLVAGLVMSGAVAAKELKIGYFDVQAVAAKIPQATEMGNTLQKEFSPRFEEVKKLEKDINFNLEKMRRDGSTMSDKQREELQATLQTQRQQYESLTGPLETEFKERQMEERNKIMTTIKTAVDTVAERDKYDMILNASVMAFAKKEYDVTDVIVEQIKKTK